MSIADIFKESHGEFKNVMVPITLIDEEFEIAVGIHETLIPAIDTLKEKVPDLVDDIYFVPNNVYAYFVFERGFVQVEVHSLEWEIWDTFQIEQRIRYWLQEMDERERDNDFEGIFAVMEKRILIPNYIRRFDAIPDEQKYNIFRDLWSRSEYGFDRFGEDLHLEDVFEYRHHSEDHQNDMEQLDNDTGAGDIITVYRGVTNRSTPYTESISWTLDKTVAEFFANRFRSDGDIYEAEVRRENIMDYMPGRNEKEVLILPKDIINPRKVEK